MIRAEYRTLRNSKDVTDILIKSFIKDDILFISKDIELNEIFGDVDFGLEKYLKIETNNKIYTFNEKYNKDIIVKLKPKEIDNKNNSEKILILYVTHIYNENYKLFIENGIFKSKNINFIIILNGCDYEENIYKITNEYSNVNILLRKNIGYDFGGWTDALFLPFNKLKNKIIDIRSNILETNDDYTYKHYNKFIFINSTIKGPIEYDPKWVYTYTNKINEKIKLVGHSSNEVPINSVFSDQSIFILKHIYNIDYKNKKTPHIQSAFFVTDNIGLKILIDYKLFSNGNYVYQNENDKVKLICQCEISMSSILLYNNFYLFSFTDIFKGIINNENENINNNDQNEYKNYFIGHK